MCGNFRIKIGRKVVHDVDSLDDVLMWLGVWIIRCAPKSKDRISVLDSRGKVLASGFSWYVLRERVSDVYNLI